MASRNERIMTSVEGNDDGQTLPTVVAVYGEYQNGNDKKNRNNKNRSKSRRKANLKLRREERKTATNAEKGPRSGRLDERILDLMISTIQDPSCRRKAKSKLFFVFSNSNKKWKNTLQTKSLLVLIRNVPNTERFNEIIQICQEHQVAYCISNQDLDTEINMLVGPQHQQSDDSLIAISLTKAPHQHAVETEALLQEECHNLQRDGVSDTVPADTTETDTVEPAVAETGAAEPAVSETDAVGPAVTETDAVEESAVSETQKVSLSNNKRDTTTSQQEEVVQEAQRKRQKMWTDA